MSEDYRERLLAALLIPPQLERFCALTGADPATLEADYTGWRKHILLAPDCVFMFPRHAEYIRLLEREAGIYAALAGLPFAVPQLIARYEDAEVSPYPFFAVTRLSGVRYGSVEAGLELAQVAALLADLGRLIASWHDLDVESLPDELSIPLAGWGGLALWRDRALDPAYSLAAAQELQGLIRRSAEGARFPDLLDRSALRVWEGALLELAGMDLVLAHRDVHEDQLLVVGEKIGGVLDWETAGVDHPLRDFDFGEWGYGLWAWLDDFPRLRRAMWERYSAARSYALPDWTRMHLYFTMDQVIGMFQRRERDETPPHVLGTLERQLELLREATRLARG